MAPRGLRLPGPWGWLRRGLAALMLLCTAAALSAAEVEVVLSDASGLYAQAAAQLKAELGTGVRFTQATAEQVERRRNGPAPQAVVALGSRALQAVLAEDSAVPVVAALIPRRAFEAARAQARTPSRAVTAVYLDQPWPRQLNLIRLLLPGRTRVGVIAGPEWDASLQLLQNAARERGLTVVRQTVTSGRDAHHALMYVLMDSEVLLAVPDNDVFNASTLPNILLTSYRWHQPVIGFSPAYVQAGALAAVYSSPQQVMGQAAEILQRVLAGGPLPQSQYPRQFSVGVNATVARSLELQVEDESVLAQRLMREEREPL